MDKLIEDVIALEKRAKEITKEANDKYAHLDELIKEDTDSLENGYMGKAKIRIEKNIKIEEENYSIISKELDKEKEKEIEKFNKIFSENKNIWVDEIYKNIIK